MYKIYKGRGYDAVVTIVNTDTGAHVLLGEATMKVVHMLNSAGIEIGIDCDTKLHDLWEFTISKELANELVQTTIKKTGIKKTTINDHKQLNKKIDAFDVLMGMAQYN